MAPSRSDTPPTLPPLDRITRRNVLLLAFGFFAGTLLLALALAALNFRLGSVNLLPGESLWLPSVVLIMLYALMLNASLAIAGLQAPAYRKIRRVLIGVSTLAASPVIGLFVVPAINGLAATGPEQAVVVPVRGIELSYAKNRRTPYYYARVAHDAAAARQLPAGRYFMGRYDRAWSPRGIDVRPEDIRSVRIRYRSGLLGARTLLEVMPEDVPSPAAGQAIR
ncbi:MAG: hypothetical protein QM739_07065 [Propionivibrio sp.]